MRDDMTVLGSSLHPEDSVCSSQLSQETFDSAISLPFDASSWLDVKNKIESIAWIQCDNQDCMKWRRMPRDELNTISESKKWYCHQNNDPNFRSCDVPEEDVALYDQLALKTGLMYLKSQLAPGALIWARMPGYCSWPAVVTPEPLTANGHISKDEDNEITHYHVEFLGQPHSHGWVASKDVSEFTESSVDRKLRNVDTSLKKTNKSSKQGHTKPRFTPGPHKLKTSYKSVSVQHGIQEAIKLLPISPHKRLDMCTYLSQSFLLHQKGNYHTKHAATMTPNNERKPKHKGRKTTPANHTMDIKAHDFTSFTSSLENKTKEERLMLDVEMYKRNERAFDHDVTRFMIRNGLKMCKGPTWHNHSIGLFQLFLAVHERGGYEQVTQQRGWTAVYREVTETPCNADASNTCAAKLFYHRYLYPYELYIHGKDFQEFIAEEKARTKNKRKALNKLKSERRKTETLATIPQDQDTPSCTVENSVPMEEENAASDSLMEMLQALEENNQLDEDVALVDDIDITFYDDSTPSLKCQLPLRDYESPDSTLQVGPSATSENESAKGGKSSSSQIDLQQLDSVCSPKALQQVDIVCTAERPPADNSSQYCYHSVRISSPQKGPMDCTCTESANSQQLLCELDVLQEEINFIDQQIG